MASPGENRTPARWQFWIDRGGTFTDIVARSTDGSLVTHKLLSEAAEHYQDAGIEGIRAILGLSRDAILSDQGIAAVKMGTTVATNALLERQGEPTVLIITRGFGDALRIGYQNRPELFARQILLPELLYDHVIEVDERYSASGEELIPIASEPVRAALQAAYDSGIRAAAIVFMHGYRYHNHERVAANTAREIGFTQVSVSHEVSPLMKLVSRGDTTVVDAYLTPILRRYVDQVAGQTRGIPLMFMQSSGGLTNANLFQGKDSILSGPAGGIVGAVRTSAMAGFEKIITFDMGGTSTDVSHYAGEYERAFDTLVAGVRMRVPIMRIHTVAAGGGSVLRFDGQRYRVGPQSAGANPGPRCYRRGGPLTVTDCNVMLGKLKAAFFPKVFGPRGNEPIDETVVHAQFEALAAEIQTATGDRRSPVEVAEGFLKIAIENMANAIKKISVQRGYDVTEYTLCCFGGAGGQHACRVADALGIKRIFIHPHAGVLSAYGMGLADVRAIREQAIEARLTEQVMDELNRVIDRLETSAQNEIKDQGIDRRQIRIQKKVHIRYEGTDSHLEIDFSACSEMVSDFETAHRERFGFAMPDKPHVVEAAVVEAIGATESVEDPEVDVSPRLEPLNCLAEVRAYTRGEYHRTPVYAREDLLPGDHIHGPAIIVESTATTIVEPEWRADVTNRNYLVLQRESEPSKTETASTAPDPVMLEVFNNLFMSVAEQMGATLANTAHSVNIKERLDFSCALFDRSGGLIANAPHIPVHLGSMSESVRSLMRRRADTMARGDVYVMNNPYKGGTHLPDITVITPVFSKSSTVILFYVASRGHHADVGGITPGSMPPSNREIHEEGVLIDDFLLVKQGRFREAEMRKLLGSTAWPARNPDQNVADLQAQIAANEKGVKEVHKMIDHFGLNVVQAYMQHVQDNAEEAVRRVLDVLTDGHFACSMDNGSRIEVDISVDKNARSAIIDFAGTSLQGADNFNAPAAVCRAAVLYVFRTLVDDDIPLNDGCLKPLTIRIPEACMLNPAYPAAVAGGNVETSQCIVDTLYGALGTMAASQGTMNNFTFGNRDYQYYETLCGGAGAGPGFDGTDAVHTHMTNSRLTDPELLEWRFPVVLENFQIRQESGGVGRYRGGNGVVRRVRFLEAMTAAILSGRRDVAPHGLAGGEPGTPGRNWVERVNGKHEDLGATAEVQMSAGDVFVIETPGGGGYGKP